MGIPARQTASTWCTIARFDELLGFVGATCDSNFKKLIRIEGYKFETLSLIPRPWGETSRELIENRETEIVNNHAQYCSVVRTGIGKTKMILGGEVDAGQSYVPLSSPNPDRL